jgi:hypothetical protein
MAARFKFPDCLRDLIRLVLRFRLQNIYNLFKSDYYGPNRVSWQNRMWKRTLKTIPPKAVLIRRQNLR